MQKIMKFISRAAIVVAVFVFIMVSAGCRHLQSPVSEVVAVFSGGTVDEDELGDQSLSPAATEQRIRDIAWHKIVVAQWRAELEGSRELVLRIAELDHQESVDSFLVELYSQVDISDEAVNEYLAVIKAKHETPKIRIRHIYFRADSDTPNVLRSEKIALARTVRERALAGESFEALAREHSDSAGAATGGLVDFVRPGMTDSRFDEVVFALSQGQISEIIETPSGYHIVRLEHRYPPQAYDEQRYRINALRVLREREEWRLRAELVDSLKQTEDPEIGWTEDGPISPYLDHGVLLKVDDFRFTSDDLQRVRRQMEPALQRWDQMAAYLENLLDRELLHRESLRRFRPTVAQLDDRRARATDRALEELAIQRETGAAKKEMPRMTLELFAADPASPLEMPVTSRTRVIFVADGESPYRASTVAEKLIDRVQRGESFATLARKYSDGPNADRGGDLGYLEKIELFKYAPELSRAVASLTIGAASDPVRITSARLTSTIHALKGGFLIVKLVDRRPARRLNLDRDEAAIRERLWEQRETTLVIEHQAWVLTEMSFRRVR